MFCCTQQRTLQKQSMTYGGKSTVRDRSSGTSSSVAFTPLQVKRSKHPLLFNISWDLWIFVVNSCSALVCRGWRSWTHRLQRRRWLKPTRNTSLTWRSSLKSRRNLRCKHTHTPATHRPSSSWTVNTQYCSDSLFFKFVLRWSFVLYLVFTFFDFCHFNKVHDDFTESCLL